MQKARRHSTKLLRPLVGRRVQGLFHSSVRGSFHLSFTVFTPLFEVLFTFPSQYWFAIGLSGVFSLTGWAPPIHTGFLVSRATQDSTRLRYRFVYRAVTVFGRSFQNVLLR